MKDLLNNNWFVSLASSIVTLGIVPSIGVITNFIRARYGVFSGTYIAITTIGKEQIIELVKCKHIRTKVKGKILGVAFIMNDGLEQKVQTNGNKYGFTGIVAERLLVVSYNSLVKGDLSAGSLTLYGDIYGITFTGNWGGLEEKEVVSSNCVWKKCSKKLNLEKDRDFILSQVKSNFGTILFSDNGMGKSRGFAYFPLPKSGDDQSNNPK